MQTLAFQSYGNGEPLVILHGIFGTGDNWATFAKQMSDNFQVFAVDQRNHGKSFHAESFNYQVLVNDLVSFLEELKLTKISLLGHSMGGKVAMLFAHQYPERLNQLVVVDIAPKQNTMDEHRLLLQSLLNINLELYSSRSDIDEALKSKIPDFSTRQFLMKGLYRQQNQFAWRMNLPALYRNLQSIGDNLLLENPYSGKSLFVRGQKSRYILDDDLPKIKEAFPKAEFATISNAGHWVQAENPVDFEQVVGGFLKSKL